MLPVQNSDGPLTQGPDVRLHREAARSKGEHRLACRLSAAQKDREQVHRKDPFAYVLFREPYPTFTGSDSLLSVSVFERALHQSKRWLSPTPTQNAVENGPRELLRLVVDARRLRAEQNRRCP